MSVKHAPRLPRVRKPSYVTRLRKDLLANWMVYSMAIPILMYYIIFHYLPMGGILIAFQRYKPFRGIWGSEWVGLKNFIDYLTGPYSFRTIRNTLLINIYQILFAFPAPILLALLINELNTKKFKKTVQTISYMPHFISMVVICGMIRQFCRANGIFNTFSGLLGIPKTNLLNLPELYRTIYIGIGIWTTIGWGSILYLATLSSIDPNLYEAASIDGATRFHKMIHITLPALVPIITIQLIMRIGSIMSEGSGKTILLYNGLTYETADIISSYVYRRGLEQGDYSFGAAVGLFNSVINILLLTGANKFSRTFVKESLW